MTHLLSLLYLTALIKGTSVPFVVHDSSQPMRAYLAMNLPFAPAAMVRKELEQKIGYRLRNRGEAHITIITPPEYTHALSAKLPMVRIDQIANAEKIQESQITPLCVGEGSAVIKGHLEHTFYVVVQASNLLKIRQQIQAEFVKRGGRVNAFNASPFYPHITLGFTLRDLYGSDGVIKNQKSCIYDLKHL